VELGQQKRHPGREAMSSRALRNAGWWDFFRYDRFSAIDRDAEVPIALAIAFTTLALNEQGNWNRIML